MSQNTIAIRPADAGASAARVSLSGPVADCVRQSPEVLGQLADVARQLAEQRFAPCAAHWDLTRSYPWPNVADLAAHRLMGMTIPPEYGGLGASFEDVVGVIEPIAGACTLTARIVVEANMGAVSAVMAYGTEAQKRFVAPIVLAGDKPAICITEPEAGSDATAMTTTARPVAGGYVIDGRKHWITGGGVSKLHLVFARVFDRTGRCEGIGSFLIHRDPDAGIRPAGFEIVRRERTMGLCGMPEAELAFDGVFVPDAMVLRPPSGFAHGFADLMSAYNSQRVGAGAVAMGVAAGALGHAIRHLKARRQFGRPLAEFQGLQWMLADMDTQVHAARLLLREAARSRGAGGSPFPDPTMAARAKLFASEMAIKVVNDALQMFGARGYGGDEPLERMARDVRMFTIGGGTVQVLRTQIASAALGMKLPQTREGAGAERDREARPAHPSAAGDPTQLLDAAESGGRAVNARPAIADHAPQPAHARRIGRRRCGVSPE